MKGFCHEKVYIVEPFLTQKYLYVMVNTRKLQGYIKDFVFSKKQPLLTLGNNADTLLFLKLSFY